MATVAENGDCRRNRRQCGQAFTSMCRAERKTILTPSATASSSHQVGLHAGALKMEDRKMEDQIWGEVKRWKMEDRNMQDQLYRHGKRRTK